MYDPSYNKKTLVELLHLGDLRSIPSSNKEAFRKAAVLAAINSATSIFGGSNPISKFHLRKKSTFRIKDLAHDLVVRKLTRNLERNRNNKSNGRDLIVTNLIHFIEEGVPFRIYRLDIKSFYESFSEEDIKIKISSLRKLPTLSKQHLIALLGHYKTCHDAQGIPRGMAISAVLSDIMMSEFDTYMKSNSFVYFYGRYVDDIIAITNLSEDESNFLKDIELQLPKGLLLNKKKGSVCSIPIKQSSIKEPPSNLCSTCGSVITPISTIELKPEFKCKFDYLGYQFSIFDPLAKDKSVIQGFRLVRIEIAENKVKKIKLRIVRALVDFIKTRNEDLLIKRVKYLTSNFSISDKKTGKRIHAGIYYSYPHLSPDSKSLAELDKFLKNAVLSNRGRLFSKIAKLLDKKLKRKLSAHSFQVGHKTRCFVHFSPQTIRDIQECWVNE